MPEYRQIHVSIWKDPWFFELNANEKFLFIYLFSNERSNLTGLYELHSKVIAFETDLNTRQIDDAFASFEKAGKVHRDGTWIWIPNLIKYNSGSLTSPKIRTHIQSSLSKIPDIPLKVRCIEYYNSMVDDEYRIDTLCIPYTDDAQEHEHEQEQEYEQEHEQENPYRVFFDEMSTAWHNYYPKKRQYGYDTVKTKIAARYKDKAFRDQWTEAMRMSCNVKALQDDEWFTFEYFIRNNANYLKLLDGTFKFKDGDNSSIGGVMGADGRRTITLGR